MPSKCSSSCICSSVEYESEIMKIRCLLACLELVEGGANLHFFCMGEAFFLRHIFFNFKFMNGGGYFVGCMLCISI